MAINPDDAQSILEGTFTLFSLFGAPVAIVSAAIISIARGVIGITNTRKNRSFNNNNDSEE